MALNEAIEHYHSLLGPDVAGESQRALDEQLRARGLMFGDRPLCTVLRPRFLTAEQYRFLQARIAVLLRAFGRAYDAAIADAAFRGQFRLFDWEETLVTEPLRLGNASPVSRLDAFFVPEKGGLRFTEYNAETPAGAAYGDLLSELFLGLPAMREFMRRYQVQTLPARHLVMHALLSAFAEWRGTREAPRVGILDWKEVPTYSEFLVTVDYLRSQGVECTIADPREVEYRDGRLTAGDFHITLIYKRVLISELVERGGLDHPVVRAVRDGAVCMVNPFHCKILHKKASLAVLSDERNADLFVGEERDAIDAHIPWTRVVEERKTRFRGETIDLVEWMMHNREQLALKPNDEYGGTGIVLGWEVGDTAWADAVQTALQEPYVVQERITIPSEAFPSMVDGALQIHDRILDTAPFCFQGDYMDGCMTRLSTASLVNVTAGGGSSVPTFLVMPR